MERDIPEETAELKEKTLDGAILELPYIPDFLFDDVRYWFVPSRASAKAVYHELVGPSAKTWETYYTKKGWSFIHTYPRQGEGPYRIRREGLDVRILAPGRIFAPKAGLILHSGAATLPIVSLEKHRPINPWKPNYIQALNFIRRYEWPHPLPRSVHFSIWEIEECGQIAGSVSWRNGEHILRRHDSEELRQTLADIFFNRPEDYPLGSEVYLRVLGLAGREGFAKLLELADHPVSRKRKVVANTLGALSDRAGVATLLRLLDDEDPDVRTSALRAVGKVGIRPEDDPEGKVAAYLQSPEIPKQVWASQALLKGGDESHQKYLVSLVKEQPRLLTDMGELGEVLSDLGLVEAVPYLIQRLKHEKSEFRADAAEALGRITSLGIEYQSIDTEEQRRNAIKTYSRWWEELKRDRRKGRSE